MERDHRKCIQHPNWVKRRISMHAKILQDKENRIIEHNKNPKLCKQCNSPIPYNKRQNSFCGHSCCATFNNKKKVDKFFTCTCGISFERKNKSIKFCSRKCSNDSKYSEFIRKWKLGEINVVRGLTVSSHVRKYLFNKNDNKCCKCGWHEVNKTSNRIPLQINHIDGNYMNCQEDNLELLCPNCHSLTHNFGSLNKGFGRKKRRDRYKIDKI